MLSSFRHLPIRRKLTIITLLTSGIALLVAGIALAAYEQVNIRKRLINNLTTTAHMTAANCAAGLDFDDAAAVEQTLRSLIAQPQVVRAWVYNKRGQPFAGYHRSTEHRSLLAPPVRADSHRFTSVSLELFQSVTHNGERLGSIFLETDLEEIRASQRRYAIALVLLLGPCSLVAWLVGRCLHRVIARPIADLAHAAARVANERDYSVRAEKQGDDELGKLTDGFNYMLAQIQTQDAALHKSHLELEQRVQERTRQLADSLSLTRATLESTTDGILVTDAAGRITGFNEQFLALWGIPRDQDDAGKEAAMHAIAAAQLLHPEQYAARGDELARHPEAESFDVLEFKDGRVWERFSKPQRVADACVGRVWSFRDVTERKRAELALARLNQDLLETSRRAGMAEVATGVLHNVGNVLNSVNVAATCIADRIRQSKAANLQRVAGLLRANQEQLAEYLAHDPKGRQLIPYLMQLAQHVQEEQGLTIQEIAELQKHIEHIKDIVAMQQNFARVCGVQERVKVTDLLEDAIRMNESAFARHTVKVVREFATAPVISVEKHKALQILVNLLRNAKQACESVDRDQRQITLRVLADAERVAITVADNGVGIPPENLTRIFSHGFTTKKNGHGFGLHSGALAAQELGGALRVASAGPGQGAAFTLELPLKPARRTI